MNILVIGAGAREHSLVWKLKKSSKVDKVFCSPGNGGIAHSATLIPSCAEEDWGSYSNFAERNKVDLTVVGPEGPLAGGIADHFRKKGLRIFGPDKNSARLESSKIFAKTFMKKYGIPTADYQTFDNYSSAFYFITNLPADFQFPLVVKADGLAAGKGVSVCENFDEAEDAIENMMVRNAFGKAGLDVLIEKKLEGEELSLMAFCDGKTIRTLSPARDYKRVYDLNQGANTGGMGSIAPAPVSEVVLKQVDQTVLQPFLKGIQSENMDFRGVIYFGLMLTRKGPYVLEFNVRFGDPETQVVLPLLKSDLLDLFRSVTDQSLDQTSLEISDEYCMSVVCASKGYPGRYENRKEINGLEKFNSNENLFIFHAGTLAENGKYYTNGGRVLNVVAKGKSLDECRTRCYDAISKISFEGIHYRKDIGAN